MAFSSTHKSLSIGQEVVAFDAASVTTGTVYSKLGHVLHVSINNTTSGAVAGQKATISGSVITISGLNASDVGTLLIIGY